MAEVIEFAKLGVQAPSTDGFVLSIGIQSGPLIGVQKGPLWRDGSWPEAA